MKMEIGTRSQGDTNIIQYDQQRNCEKTRAKPGRTRGDGATARKASFGSCGGATVE